MLINRRTVSVAAGKVVGKVRVARFQSWLVKTLMLHKEYNGYTTNPPNINGKTYIFFVDGKVTHGGISDRLNGILSTYLFCKEKGFKFKISWNYPFRLQDFFVPNNIDWIEENSNKCKNTKLVDVRFLSCCYADLIYDEKNFFKFMESKKPIVHVYSNEKLHTELYHSLFKELFKPSERLQEVINLHLKKIGGKYVSISFRFAGALGDFNEADTRHYHQVDDTSAKEYVQKCLHAIEMVEKKYAPEYHILVTADSPKFLTIAQKEFPSIYVISGTISHTDNTNDGSFETHLKTFVDFMMIANAELVFQYAYQKMRFGGFSYTASLIGGKKYMRIIN